MIRLATIVVFSLVLSASGPVQNVSHDLARLWDAEHVSSPISPLVDHAEVKRRIGALPADVVRVREVGKSLEGREIWDVTFGTGPFVVMMWSQMHGDEPTATSALFDLYEYLRRHRNEPPCSACSRR